MMSLQEKIVCAGAVLKTIVRNARGIKLDPEIQILPKLISPGAVCLDIGAAYGRYALSISKASGPTGHVYCFEPAEHSFSALSAIVKFYRLRNVTLVKKGLSNRPGTGKLALPIKKSTVMGAALGHSLAHLEAESDCHHMSHSISLTTLDDFVAETGLSRLDFIKCDVEGAELFVFEGGRNAIERFQPIILTEIYKTWLARYQNTPDDTHRFFAAKGYDAFIFEDRKLSKVNTVELDGNYFFIPIGR